MVVLDIALPFVGDSPVVLAPLDTPKELLNRLTAPRVINTGEVTAVGAGVGF